MLDFTALPTRNKFYAGANGAKIAVIYDGEQYMLKFPAPAPKNKELSYANSCISEYIGAIFSTALVLPHRKHFWESTEKTVRKKLLLPARISLHQESCCRTSHL